MRFSLTAHDLAHSPLGWALAACAAVLALVAATLVVAPALAFAAAFLGLTLAAAAVLGVLASASSVLLGALSLSLALGLRIATLVLEAFGLLLGVCVFVAGTLVAWGVTLIERGGQKFTGVRRLGSARTQPAPD